ncbi:MAG: ABC transporter substrate-binding protein [Candidatus Hodarchaeota archaeon]
MTKRKQKFNLLIVFFIILIIGYLGENLTINYEEKVEDKRQKNLRISGYWPLDFIHVDGNWTQTNSTFEWCSGSGTEIDPYLIEDVVIDGQNSSSCIIIENTNEYFKIKNCTLFNSTGAGIELNNVSNSQLIGNNCSNNNLGISLHFNSINNTISANFINNNSQFGIIMKNAHNNLIFNNTIIWNNINAFDNGTNNDWDNGAIGNYWSDYDGVDIDNDGIGDTPYTIPSKGQDNYPLWDRYVVPGVNEYVPSEQFIKIGLINDMNHITGKDTWNGAFLAAKEINEAGGVLINSSTFYISLVSQNTFEFEEPFDKPKAVDAVNNLISIHGPDFIIGGVQQEAGAAYIETIMDAKIPFLGSALTLGNLTQAVLNNYTRYKYFFRGVINGTELVNELLTFQIYLFSNLSAVLSRPINKVAFLYEEKYKFPPLVDALKAYLPSFGIEMVKEIKYNSSASKIEFDQYWNEIDNAGAQITFVGSFFSDNAKLLSESYGDIKPRCLIFSTVYNGTTNTYWTDSNEGCEYEISYQALYNISRTSRSKPFWNNFVNEYNYEPMFVSMSAYNAIYLIVNASQDSQSFSADKIVDSLEKIDTGNTFPGVTAEIAFTASHDIYTGLGYAGGLMCQWQSGGTKVVIPNGNLIYLDSLATGSLQPPDWGVNIRFTINSPIENNAFSEISPNFDIEILDAVDKMWYTFNTDPTKYFFTMDGSINQTAWIALPDGVNRINFYANESSGDTYRRYVSVIKDTLPPSATVESTGSDTDTFGSEPPTITLNISDLSGITESYYSLDGGVTKIPFTGNVVTINQTLWDTLGEGVVTISFYIIDAVGKETIIYKDVIKQLPTLFDPLIYIIIGVAAVSIGVMSTVIITQQRRKKRRKTAWVKLKKKKGLISPELAEGKCLIFISYATKDSDLFQIPLITEILTQYPEIDDILYWESDMHDDIYEYMDDNLKLCSAFLLFCTENSLYSEPVKMEWRSALKLDKKIIPIFINPNDIPPLLTTKLGVQYNTSDVYDSIEALYQMILKKLEITSTREFCEYLIPKEVSEEDFDEKAVTMTKKDIIIETDVPLDDLQSQVISILEKNNFQFLGKPIDIKEIEKLETQLISLRFFAEDKFQKQEIGSKVSIQKVDDLKSKIYLRVMGNKEWMINEIISDLDNKCYALKTVTELLRLYSDKIKSFLDQIKDINEFLSPKIGAEIKKIEETIQQYLNKKIEKDEFIKNGIQLLGKRFILLFIENLSKFPYEKEILEDKDEELDTPISL